MKRATVDKVVNAAMCASEAAARVSGASGHREAEKLWTEAARVIVATGGDPTEAIAVADLERRFTEAWEKFASMGD